MTFSYDATWQDISRMLRSQADILLIVAGVFLFLPALAQAFYFPLPVVKELNEAAVRTFLAYYEDSFFAVFSTRLVVLLGTGTLLSLLASPGAPTVGGAISASARLLPSLFLVDIISQFLVFGGLALLIAPGLYLLGRMAVATPAMMAENIGNPLRALGRSFTLTHGKGWQLFGLISIFMIALWIATSASVTVLGVVTSLVLPKDASQIAQMVLAALSTTILLLGSTMLAAGMYRQLRSNTGI